MDLIENDDEEYFRHAVNESKEDVLECMGSRVSQAYMQKHRNMIITIDDALRPAQGRETEWDLSPEVRGGLIFQRFMLQQHMKEYH